MKRTTLRFLLLMAISGMAVFVTGCASDFGEACTRFFEP